MKKYSFFAQWFLLLATFFIVTADCLSEDAAPPASPEVTTALQPYLDSYKMAGIIGIVADRSGKIRYRNLLGYADVETKQPISENNVFWIASMSKMFVGASIMMLVDEGKVSLDDPVTNYIPELAKWMVLTESNEDHVLLKPLVRLVTFGICSATPPGLPRCPNCNALWARIGRRSNFAR